VIEVELASMEVANGISMVIDEVQSAETCDFHDVAEGAS
jgi:hypothetical protein